VMMTASELTYWMGCAFAGEIRGEANGISAVVGEVRGSRSGHCFDDGMVAWHPGELE
jgi:hypothetical protein